MASYTPIASRSTASSGTSSSTGSRNVEDGRDSPNSDRSEITHDERYDLEPSWSASKPSRTGTIFGGRSSTFDTIQRVFIYLAGCFVVLVLGGAIFGSTLSLLFGGGHEVLKRNWDLKADDVDAKLLRTYRPPEDVQVKGLVFFGRRRTASMLACYLERNLKRNGGLLDRVVWLQGTDVPEEVEWMNDIVASTPGFTTFYNEMFAKHHNYVPAYGVALNETHPGETVYIKIDDDIVFMDDGTVPSLVHRLLTDYQKPFLVGANVVNQPALAWLHQSLGGVDVYMPELNRPEPENGRRPLAQFDEEQPEWSGPEDYRVPREFKSPKPRSRWLPIDVRKWPMIRTPVGRVEIFAPFSNAWQWWAIGAQQHYSLLGRLMRNDLTPLKYGRWDFNYIRMGIQFIAIRRSDILAHYPFENPDDEHFLSVQAPEKVERPALVDGRNVVSHYAFGRTKEGLDTTDILERYATFAERKICRTAKLKSSIRTSINQSVFA